MELHPDDHEELLHGNTAVQLWRRSDHAVQVAEELMKMHGGTVPMSDLLWLGAEAILPRQWKAGRAPEPVQAAVEVYNRWRKLEERRVERRRQADEERRQQAGETGAV
jgi:1,4-alpha-glucan branching enzyme